MDLRVGDRVRLAYDNQVGVGKKGDTGFIVSTLYRPTDEYDYIVKFDFGGTEGFGKSALKKQIKQLTRI